MTYVIPPGFSRFTVQFAEMSPSGSRPTFGFGTDLNPSPTFIDELQAVIEGEYVPILNDEYTITRLEMRSDALVYTKDVTLAGDSPEEGAVPNTAALVTLASGLPGRANRGRIYLPGVIPYDQVSGDGQMFDGRRELITDFVTALEAELDTLGGSFQILHSSSSDPTAVLSWNVQQLVATQRRRLRR